jgi:hypothetical protein
LSEGVLNFFMPFFANQDIVIPPKSVVILLGGSGLFSKFPEKPGSEIAIGARI